MSPETHNLLYRAAVAVKRRADSANAPKGEDPRMSDNVEDYLGDIENALIDLLLQPPIKPYSNPYDNPFYQHSV